VAKEKGEVKSRGLFFKVRDRDGVIDRSAMNKIPQQEQDQLMPMTRGKGETKCVP